MYNLTVIVGPKDDPAKIEGLKDLTMAHKKIHEAKAKYLARGDGGRMDLLEKKISGFFTTQLCGTTLVQREQEIHAGFADRCRQKRPVSHARFEHLGHASQRCLTLSSCSSGPGIEYEICLISPEKHPNLRYNFEYAEKFYHFLSQRARPKNHCRVWKRSIRSVDLFSVAKKLRSTDDLVAAADFSRSVPVAV